jgi:hypothetical protein
MLIAGMLRNAAHEWWLDPAGVDLTDVKHETLLMIRSRLSPGWGSGAELSTPSAHA